MAKKKKTTATSAATAAPKKRAKRRSADSLLAGREDLVKDLKATKAFVAKAGSPEVAIALIKALGKLG